MQKKPIILGLVAVLLTAVAVWYFTRPVDRFIHGIKPIGPNEAILLTRHNGDDATHIFIERVRTDGTGRWEYELPERHLQGVLSTAGVAADASRVFLLVESELGIDVLAVSREDGTLLWREQVAAGVRQSRLHEMLHVDGERLVILHTMAANNDDPSFESITTLDTTTGKVVWPKRDDERLVISYQTECSIVGAGRLNCSRMPADPSSPADWKTNAELDIETGELLQRLPFLWDQQLTAIGLIGQGLKDLFIFPTNAADQHKPTSLLRWTDFHYGGHESPVGIFEDLIIIGATTNDPEHGRGSQSLVGIEYPTGTVRWKVEAPGSFGFAEYASYNGVLPRFFPFMTILMTHDDTLGDANQQLIMVDLRTGERVFEERGTEQVQVFATPTRAIIFERFRENLSNRSPQPILLSSTEPATFACNHCGGGSWHERKVEGRSGWRPWLSWSEAA